MLSIQDGLVFVADDVGRSCCPVLGTYGAEAIMRLYRYLRDFHGSENGIALAIGNFDGFHVGHQAVIKTMQEKARRLVLNSAVMIFEPQPLEFFGDKVPARLFTLRDKLRLFQAAEVDFVFCMKFTQQFANFSDTDYVDMLDRMQIKSVTVGSLFSFGKGGKFTFTHLQDACLAHGIECSQIAKVEDQGIRISSTLLRSLIESGDFVTARKYMGHDYTIAGRVVHGNALGRTLGFPTANINLNRYVCPLSGVYAVVVECKYGVFKGVANVGKRPTISSERLQLLLEINLFNFAEDLYGSVISISFKYKLRDEIKFANLDALVKQIAQDKERAAYLLSLPESGFHI